MSRTGRWAAGVLIITALAAPACAQKELSTAKKAEPFTLDKIEGTDVSRLTLEAEAAERIGVETGIVGERPGDPLRTTIPYAALLYGADGTTSVYTSPEPFVYVRHPITVDYIQGDRAVLRDGPPTGTSVVTTGAAELTGIEFGVGK